MVLSDAEIQERVGIEPFESMTKRPGRISFGVSSYGYDVRVGTRFKVFKLQAILESRQVEIREY